MSAIVTFSIDFTPASLSLELIIKKMRAFEFAILISFFKDCPN